MTYLFAAFAAGILALNGFYLARLLKRPNANNVIQQIFGLVLLGFSALALYTFGNVSASQHEILAKSDGTVINGPASSFQLSDAPDRIVISREDCVFKKIKHGKDLVAVTVRYKVLDKIDSKRLFEIMPEGVGSGVRYFRNHLKRSISIPVEVPSNEALIALALQASFLKYHQAGVLVTVTSVVVIDDGAEMRRFDDE